MRHLMIAGNWKMNKDLFETLAFAQGLRAYAQNHNEPKVEMVIAPVYTFLLVAEDVLKGVPVKVAAQDVSFNEDGAFTGEVSATMLASLHLPYCIVGHSERRQYHNEINPIVNLKLKQLLKNGIIPIFCIGERLDERESNQTNSVLERQLEEGLEDITLFTGKEIIIAYEPVWAIGTGKVATPEQAQQAHAFIRNWLKAKFNDKVTDKLQILYGGSVKPDNIKELMLQQDIDGALIGGASLKLEQYIAMVETSKEVVKQK